MSITKLTVSELHAKMKAQGVSGRDHIACKCVICGTVQSLADFVDALGKPADEVEKYFGFSCIGRFTGAGPHKRGSEPGKGCDWTLGGLFTLHTTVVVTDDGKEIPYFELATPEEAKAHEKARAQVAA